jgi:D-aspartate ligase
MRLGSVPDRRASSAAQNPAVVVGADACGLGIIRSLGSAGVPVVIVDCDSRRPGMHSRYARSIVSKALSGPALVDALSALRDRIDRRAMLFLTTDAQVQTISEHRSQLEDAFYIRLPAHRCVFDLLHKAGFQRAAESHGFPVPVAISVRNERDLAELARIRFPAVVKPGLKEGFLRGMAPRAHRVLSRYEAKALCRSILPSWPDLIVQEWIEGAESDIHFCLQYRGENGLVVSSFTGRKLRCWPPQTGSTASCTWAPEAEPELEALTNAFFEKTGLVGMCSMEFKRDRRSGAFVMIEPTVGRVDWQEEVARLHGINIPLAAYCYELGLPLPAAKRTEVPVIWRDPPCYWRSVLATRSFGDRTPSAAKVKSTCWRIDDLLPVGFFWYEWARKAWRPSRWRA